MMTLDTEPNLAPAQNPPNPRLTLNALLDETAARFPRRPALVTADEELDFAGLKDRVARAAAAFAARGIQRGDCVSIVLRNSIDFVVSYFGLVRLGATAVPINFMVQKPEELRYMLNDCGAVGVVTQKEFLKGIVAAKASLPRLKSLWCADGADEARGAEDLRSFFDAGDPARLPAHSPATASDVATILYTSGTTGSPKGVMLTHFNLMANSDATLKALRLGDREVCLCILPMFHAFAWCLNVLLPLRIGAKNVISPSVTPAKPWLKLMGRHGVTVFCAVPPIYSVLAREIKGVAGLVLKYWFFRKVKICGSGAAPLSKETAETFRKAMGVAILEGYGLTETSPVATLNTPDRPRPGSVGRPIEGVELKIISDDEKTLPVGSEGEVCIRGHNIMKGYHQLPDATRESFTRDGWFKSGDIGVLDEEGYLYLRDRKKDMIIIKGLKVFSAQLEGIIASHPAVEEVAVVGIPDEGGDETIKAFIVLKQGAAADKAALQQFCREKLDPYKRPRDIEIVQALPKNALQKVLKRELRQQEIQKRR